MENGFNYFKTDDGLSIRYFIQKSPGSRAFGNVVFLPGRAGFIEKHLETMGELSGRR